MHCIKGHLLLYGVNFVHCSQLHQFNSVCDGCEETVQVSFGVLLVCSCTVFVAVWNVSFDPAYEYSLVKIPPPPPPNTDSTAPGIPGQFSVAPECLHHFEVFVSLGTVCRASLRHTCTEFTVTTYQYVSGTRVATDEIRCNHLGVCKQPYRHRHCLQPVTSLQVIEGMAQRN